MRTKSGIIVRMYFDRNWTMFKWKLLAVVSKIAFLAFFMPFLFKGEYFLQSYILPYPPLPSPIFLTFTDLNFGQISRSKNVMFTVLSFGQATKNFGLLYSVMFTGLIRSSF